MEVHFNHTYSFLILFGAAIFAFLISFLVYNNKNEDILSKKQELLLSVIRFLVFFLIAVILSKPIIKRFQHKKLDPVMVLAVDNSQSIKNEEVRVNQFINDFEREFSETKLILWKFGEQSSPSSDFTFDEKQSDYSELLTELNKHYLNSQLSAVLLLGDGIYNKGQDPAFTSKMVPFPVFTVGLGDTTLHVDSAIKRVTTNKQTLINNYFPIEIDLDFSMASGQQAILTIENEGKQHYSKSILINSNKHFFSDLVNLKAGNEGINNYKVRVSALNGETNLSNNSYDFSIQVVAKKQRILLLGSGAHPDLAALNKTLSANPNYDIEIITGLKQDIDFSKYDLIIAHQIPSKRLEFKSITEHLFQSQKPVLFIVGQQSSIKELNLQQDDIRFENTQGLFENSKATINDQFNLFQLLTDFKEAFAKYPPLQSPFGNITYNDEIQAMVFQNIQGLPTNNPLVVIGSRDKSRRAYVFGEGIWRWRLYDYLQNGTHRNVDEFFLKIVNYLVIKQGEDNFNINHQAIYLENESVIFNADLFNASNELTTEPNIELDIISEDSVEYHYIFDRQDLQYQLNAGRLPIGNYSYLATTTLASEELADSGVFRVSPSQLEILETKANHQLLKKIALNTGGHFYTVNELPELLKKIKSQNLSAQQTIKQSIFQKILDIKLLFVLLIILSGMEWFLRKFWGTY